MTDKNRVREHHNRVLR